MTTIIITFAGINLLSIFICYKIAKKKIKDSYYKGYESGYGQGYMTGHTTPFIMRGKDGKAMNEQAF